MNVKRCRDCGTPITLARMTTTNGWAAFNPLPVADSAKDANRHWFLTGILAAPIRQFVDHIQQTRQVPDETARDIARTEYPWHAFHDCPNRPTTDEENR